LFWLQELYSTLTISLPDNTFGAYVLLEFTEGIVVDEVNIIACVTPPVSAPPVSFPPASVPASVPPASFPASVPPASLPASVPASVPPASLPASVPASVPPTGQQLNSFFTVILVTQVIFLGVNFSPVVQGVAYVSLTSPVAT